MACSNTETLASWPLAATAALAFLLTLGTALVGLPLQQERIAVFWPAAGVIAGLVLGASGGRRLAVALGALAALAIGNALQRRGLATTLVFMAGNTGQALLLAVTLERSNGRPVRLDTLQRVGMFLLLAGGATALTALGTAVGLRATGHAGSTYGRVWYLWFTSHTLGILTVAPALLALSALPGLTAAARLLCREGVLMLVLLTVVAYVLAGLSPDRDDVWLIATCAVLYPLLLWIAMRHTHGWSTGALGLLALMVIWHTTYGSGLFATRPAAAQLFLGLAAMWTLTLGAMLEQQRRAGEAQAALREREKHLLLATAAAEVGLWWWEPDTGRTYWDARIRAMWGVEPDTEINLAMFLASLHPEDHLHVQAVVEQIRRDPATTHNVEYRIRRPDGTERWLAARARLLTNGPHQTSRLTGVALDITERKQVELALHASEARLRLAQAAARVGAWDYDLRTHIAQWTPEMFALYGLAQESTAPPLEQFAALIHPADRATATAAMQAAAGRTGPFEIEFRAVRPDGTRLWVSTRGIVEGDSHGRPRLARGVDQDITARKQVEEALRDLTATLEQRVQERTTALEEAMATQRRLEREAQRAEHFSLLGRLAAGVSHELRNPLGAVFLNVDLLAEELHELLPDGATGIAESLAEIKANLGRVEDLVEDYLSLVRVRSMTPTVQDLGAALQGWVAEFQALAAARGMTLCTEGLATLGAVAFHANTLRRALLNLVQNAVEAMAPGGTLTLRGQVTAGQVALQVQDTGGGIPAARLQQIFEPLHTTKPGGTGLGLYIVQEVVAAHGGQMTVASTTDVGTTFTVTLPRRTPAQQPEAEWPPRSL